MSTAIDLINQAKGYAAGTIADGQAAMERVISIVENIAKPENPPTLPTLPNSVPAIEVDSKVPAYTGSKYSGQSFDVSPPSLETVTVDAWPHPPTGSEPTPPGSMLDNSLRPSGHPGEFSESSPTVRYDFPLPTDPNLLDEIRRIPKPDLIPIKVPDLPQIQEPVFDGVLPEFDVKLPTAEEIGGVMRSEYTDAANSMRAAIVGQIEQFIQIKWPGLAGAQAQIDKYLAGGTGFKPEVEEAIFARTLDKTNNESRKASAKAWGEAARAGFTIPSAILLSQQQDIDQERRNLNARAAIDIAIKQAELEQANLQFATQQSVQLVNVIANAAVSYINSLVAINGQAVEYSRSIVDALVKGYDIAAKYAEIRSRLFEAQAKVYEVKWQGVQAKVDAYKAQIQSLQAVAQVDEAKVAIYRAQLEAVQSEATVYKSQVDSMVSAAGLERLKVDLYQAQVQAYAARVNAYSAQWQGFEAVARSDAARYAITEAQMRVYLEKWQAYETEVKATSSKIESVARVNEARVKQYGAQAEVFATKVRAEGEGIRAETAAYEAEVRAFTADSEAKGARYRAEVAAWEAMLKSLVAQTEVVVQKLKMENEQSIARTNSAASLASAVGHMYAGVAQSALSGMNSLASVAATEL